MNSSSDKQSTLAFRIVTSTLKGVIRILCRVHDEQLVRVPQTGPLIAVANHINFLEVPLLYTHLMPRPVTGFAKAEHGRNIFGTLLFEVWDGIPLNRGEADMAAFRQALKALKAGKILAVAPEGTRSGHGRLQQGLPGAVFLALHSGAPVLPIAYWGGELFWHNLPRLRRTEFYMAVGRPFHIDAGGVRVTHQVRYQMADEMMYQIAALLPPPYRGIYSDLDAATETYLQFPPGSESNLLHARV